MRNRRNAKVNKKINLLLSLIMAATKSKFFDCTGCQSKAEILARVVAAINSFARDSQGIQLMEGIFNKPEFIRMDVDKLIKLAEASTSHKKISPTDAVRILYVHFDGHIPQRIISHIVMSGEDKSAVMASVLFGMEPVMPLISQLVTTDTEGNTHVDERWMVDGATRVKLVCSNPCELYGNCKLFSIVEAVLKSPIFGRYLPKKEIQDVDEMMSMIRKTIAFCKVPKRTAIVDPEIKFGKLKHIAKGFNGFERSKIVPSDAVYGILALEGNYSNEAIFRALRGIIEIGENEPAVMLAASRMMDFAGGSPLAVGALVIEMIEISDIGILVSAKMTLSV